MNTNRSKLLSWILVLSVCVACRHSPPAQPGSETSALAATKNYVPNARRATDVKLINQSPYLSTQSFRYLTPAFEALNQRLRDAERVAQSRAVPIRQIFLFTYGSGFLKQILVGNDLDGMVGIHLGDVRLESAHPEAAAELLISRMEDYLHVFHRSTERMSAEDLSILNWRLLRDGKFKNRDLLKQKLTDSLRDVAAARPHRVFVESLSGVRVPTVLSSQESYIYETTRIQLFSDRIRSLEWMFSGIREFQVMFHFFCDLEIVNESGQSNLQQDFAIHPTFVPSGSVLGFRDNLIGLIPIGEESAEWISHKAKMDLDSMVQERIELAQRSIAEVNRNVATNDRLKAVKRLHQARDAIAPALDPRLLNEVDEFVGKALRDDQVLLCADIAEMAGNAEKTFEVPPLLAIYGPSYDLQRLFGRLSFDMETLSRNDPDRWSEVKRSAWNHSKRLREIMERFPPAEQRQEAAALLKGMSNVGESCLDQRLPSKEFIHQLLAKIEQRLFDAGFRSLPVYGMPDGSVGILQKDLTGFPVLADLEKEIEAAGAPDFSYRIIQANEIPKDRNQKDLPSSKTLWLRLRPNQNEESSYRKLQAALQSDTANYDWFERSENTPDYPAMRHLFLERFGETGKQAWSRSRTGGEGFVSLLVLDTSQARELLERHLELIQKAGPASLVLPLFGDSNELQAAMEQALATTSERILEGVAVAHATENHEGLTFEGARHAQQQLLDMEMAFLELSQNQAKIIHKEETDETGAVTYSIQTNNSSILQVLVRPRRHPSAQARVAFSLVKAPGISFPQSLNVRMDVSSTYGAGIDIQYSPERIDWAVHGPLKNDPYIPDHHFFDRIPDELVGSTAPGRAEKVSTAFANYIETRFIPEVLGDLK